MPTAYREAADTPAGEQEHLAVLRSYRILDTPPVANFDKLARIAAAVCNTPIAVISLVDEHRQWFKAVHGPQVSETDIAVSFCKDALQQSGLFPVRDASAHPTLPTIRRSPANQTFAFMPDIRCSLPKVSPSAP